MKGNMMKRSAAVFLVTMLLVSGLMGGAAPVTEDDRIPIVAYWEGLLDQTSAAAYKLMAEGGVTHGILARSWKGSLTDIDTALDAAHEAGIKLIPTCRELKNTPETAVAHLKSHPALAGYFVADEPSASDFPALAKTIGRIRSVDTNHPCYINLFPNYASSKQLGTATYQKYVDKFLANVPVEFLSFDNYPISNYSVRPGWYENLEIVSKAAKAKGIPFWAFALTSTHYKFTPSTLSQLRLQMHANLAYGAQALQYFPYWQPNVNHFYCPINADGTQGPLYEIVKTLNGEIQAVAGVFKSSSVLRVGHTGKKAQWWDAGKLGTNVPRQKEGPVPNGTSRYKPASPVASFIAQGRHGAIVSELVNGKNRYLVVVNKDYAHVMVLRITFDRTKDISVIGKDGSAAALEKNVFMKLVDPGDIVIFTWSDTGTMFLFGLTLGAQENDRSVKLVEVRKIWDKANHNAFTDLLRFQDRWFCVFREGKSHISPDGALRVITSTDGEKWESAAVITSTNSDLRDAKITVTPDGQLMLCGAEALHDKSKHTHQSLVWFSKDGRTWSDRQEIGDPNFWLWRMTWHKGKAYSIGYRCGKDKSVRLYSSNDGKRYKTLVDRLFDVGKPNESSLVFEGDTAYCLLRRDGKPNTGLFGVSRSPYAKWEWKDLGVRIGGPCMLRLPDGRFVAVVRLHDGKGWNPAHTSLCWINSQSGKLSEILRLPSGGDTSYAGLALHDGLLWISYYSSHEGKTAIYLAKVKIDN